MIDKIALSWSHWRRGFSSVWHPRGFCRGVEMVFMKAISFNTLQSLAASVGLSVVAVAEPQILTEDMDYLKRWQGEGYAGEMSYMLRDPGLLASPERLMEGVRSVVVIGAFYDRSERAPLKPGFGRVARYAWGKDYHKVLRRRLHLLVEQVERELGIVPVFRVFSDSVPLLERAVAKRAGIGFIGKNTLVIVPRAGSFMFLGEVLWDLEVTDLPSVQGEPSDRASGLSHGKSHCGTCSQCLDACPSGAFVEPYLLDARRCISYLTIEKRGALSLQERRWLGEWVFGCDVCQEVCPFNVLSMTRRAKADLSEFEASLGVGQMLSLEEVLGMRNDSAFTARFAGTPLTRAKREGLLRNAAVVAANTESIAIASALKEAVISDPSAVVRQHALWAHCHLSVLEGSATQQISKELLSRSLRDPESCVREEAVACAQVIGD
jgi:epoxyqueuosine reductase